MNTEATEALNWQDVISGWSFTCGGEAPPEGLEESVVPSVSRSNDGLFEITTISFGFTGTAPYNQQKFTADFSFSVSGAANFYEVSVSSDDTATVRLGGNDFVSSRLNVPGVASSVWNETASTLPAVSGTFETIGGPYSLSVTITLKRLVGAEWTVSETWTESGPYEIKTATLSFSGTARSDTLGFSWNSLPVEIDGGSWVEISVEADDEATISVGGHSVTATLNNPATYNSDWMEEAPSTFPLLVSYRNAGGPYRLSVTVTVKRSLRVLKLGFLYVPPIGKEEGMQDFAYPPQTRRIVGAGEEVCVYICSRTDNTVALGALESITLNSAKGSHFVGCKDCGSEVVLGGEYFVYEGAVLFNVKLTDGEVLKDSVCVLFPYSQKGDEVSTSEYLVKEDGSAFTQEELNSEDEVTKAQIAYAREMYPGELKRYKVRISAPEGVSFSGICYWECVGECLATGVFCDESFFPPEWKIHNPAKTPEYFNPAQNHWIDRVGMALHALPPGYKDYSEGEELGRLVWTIPLRWQFYASNEERHAASQIPNDDRAYLGEFSFKSVQTMICLRTAVGVKVVVSKKFSEDEESV